MVRENDHVLGVRLAQVLLILMLRNVFVGFGVCHSYNKALNNHFMELENKEWDEK